MEDQRDTLEQELKHSEAQFVGLVGSLLDQKLGHFGELLHENLVAISSAAGTPRGSFHAEGGADGDLPQLAEMYAAKLGLHNRTVDRADIDSITAQVLLPGVVVDELCLPISHSLTLQQYSMHLSGSSLHSRRAARTAGKAALHCQCWSVYAGACGDHEGFRVAAGGGSPGDPARLARQHALRRQHRSCWRRGCCCPPAPPGHLLRRARQRHP